MPRRKRTADEAGRRVKVSRVEHNDEETLVISDSEHEEVLCMQYATTYYVWIRLKVSVWFKSCLNGIATNFPK